MVTLGLGVETRFFTEEGHSYHIELVSDLRGFAAIVLDLVHPRLCRSIGGGRKGHAIAGRTVPMSREIEIERWHKISWGFSSGGWLVSVIGNAACEQWGRVSSAQRTKSQRRNNGQTCKQIVV